MRVHLLVLVACLLATAGTARATEFQVQPTRIDLAGKQQVGSVTVTNRGNEPVRLEVSAMSWSEDENGKMTLVPTKDLIIFPTLLTIAAGADREVRVATTVKRGGREVAYRIIVAELAPLAAPGASGAGHVTMLTKMSIPVFLPPTKETVNGSVSAALAADGLALDIRNSGSVHVRVTKLRVVGEGPSGVVFDQSLTGWYVLAGGRRHYALPVTAADKAKLSRIRVEAVTDRATWTTAVELPAASAAP
ncbi:MAG TPA: fimbria/pilus periplasmic chaperone [Kofleriaceae bacterium]|nr:fimbria/pilus periplasmic chaperone [Kofleriaceae bacterium]